MEENVAKRSLNFIEQIVEDDLRAGLNDGRVQTRFPPEPNGYLHIGHAKAICMDFGIAEMYGGTCNLRFDDTNPVKEDVEYVDSIMEDIKWLGFEWDRLCYTSDYFQQLYDLAVKFIEDGKAYIDEQTAEEIAAQKGTPTTAGEHSPYRDRPVAENLDLFRRMQEGEFEDGAMVLRAKIDMAHSNMHFRDPIMYRIIKKYAHHRTGTKWNVYPMYDFAHGQSDYFEGVTHSICTLEFEVHRPLYDYYLDQFAGDYRPKQREFNRLNLTYTVMSKRKLLQLVEEGLVRGWDDPRMPTVCGLRRRGYTPEAIRSFIGKIGYTKTEAMNDVALLEASAREDLKPKAHRVCAIMDPVKLVITNYPEGESEVLYAENNPEDEMAGTREVKFARESYIERGDFLENADNKFYRLSPNGREVRLKGAYIIQAKSCDKDAEGNVTTVYAEYDPNTKSGTEGGNKKVKSTINWVNVEDSVEAEVRIYDRLFACEDPSAEEGDFRDLLNADSMKVISGARVEPYLRGSKPGDKYQFLKVGYFNTDLDSTDEKLVFNLTVSLKEGKK